MTNHFSRREIIAAAAMLPLLPRIAGVQTTGTILIAGQSFTGTPVGSLLVLELHEINVLARAMLRHLQEVYDALKS